MKMKFNVVNLKNLQEFLVLIISMLYVGIYILKICRNYSMLICQFLELSMHIKIYLERRNLFLIKKNINLRSCDIII